MTKTLRILLIISAVVSVIAVLVDAYSFAEYSMLPSGADYVETLLPSDLLNGIVGLAQSALSLFLGIIFLMWIYRANKNLHALSNMHMKFTPGWSVGWYFIPVANLFMPFQSMREIWEVAHKGRPSRQAVLYWWWIMWIGSNMIGGVAAQFSFAVSDVRTFMASTIVYLVSDGLQAASSLVALYMVTRIGEAYMQSYTEPGAAVYSNQSSVPQSQGQIPPGWYADPTSRNELRYWDGVQWTSIISNGGVQMNDRLM